MYLNLQWDGIIDEPHFASASEVGFASSGREANVCAFS